uniref:Uncharacterized protein n=1 Tax=Lepeophtheirus salmonis TaxID=72036 RepID=A0A0K2SVL0_LEPSM
MKPYNRLESVQLTLRVTMFYFTLNIQTCAISLFTKI